MGKCIIPKLAMPNETGVENQLKDAAQISGADWAVLANRSSGTWQLDSVYHLNKASQVELTRIMSRPAVDTWLCGALSGGHSRSSSVPPDAKIQTRRMYAFPLQGTSRLILVGADNLKVNAQKVWKLLVSLLVENSAATTQPFLPDLHSGLAFDLPLALEKILAVFVETVRPQGAWLALRRGEMLEVFADHDVPKAKGISLTIESNPLLRRVNRSLIDVIVSRGHPMWEDLPAVSVKPGTQQWVCVPLVIGRRMIGVVVFWRQKELTASELTQVRDLALKLAPSVEVVATFSEMAAHLRRLALVNDFVLTISSAQNLDQITKRMFGLLSRAFNTELISFYLKTTQDNVLNEYKLVDGILSVVSVARLDPLIEGMVMDNGRVRVVDDFAKIDDAPLHKAARSMLGVPLKYRGRVIGAVILESERSQAFNQYDEHLMVVIASHLAGLVEYSRLREEAEARARNLGLLHEVVQQVIGLTNTNQIADVTARFVASFFKYDLTGIFLTDESGSLSIQGLGGKYALEVRKVLAKVSPVEHGVLRFVLQEGASAILADTSLDHRYKAAQNWAAQSGVYVPIKRETQVLGVIFLESKSCNAFSSHDLIAMESLAGILTAVLFSASQYQRLQQINQQLLETESELTSRITAQKSAEAKLVQAAKLAAVGEMAASIAHELNNPLTTVTGFSEIVLADLPVDSVPHRDLNLVLQEARRASSVVRRLLDFSRRGDSARAGAAPNGIVEDVLALTRHLINTSAVELELDLCDALPWILVDDNQIKQVLLNLIHNGLHAMPGGGTMRISTRLAKREDREWVVLSVEDNGKGIPKDNQQRIFEPFYTTKSEQGGTGLGLSVTYNIVADHGGTIEVASDEGLGTVFDVWLPVIAKLEAANPAIKE